MWVGLPQLVILPFVPKLMKLVDPRIIGLVGIAPFGGSCFIDAFVSPDFAMDQFRFSNSGLSIFFIPKSQQGGGMPTEG